MATIPRPFGAEVTFFGVATSFNVVRTPDATAPDGTPIFTRPLPQGFILVLEGRTGTSGSQPSSCGVQNGIGGIEPCFSNSRPGVQVQPNRPLGNGSGAVCDRVQPNIGGVPGFNPPDFGPSETVTDAFFDFACRFGAYTVRAESCTFNRLGNYDFVHPTSTRQFCTAPALGTELAFPSGDTRLTAQLEDFAGNVGNQKSIIIRAP